MKLFPLMRNLIPFDIRDVAVFICTLVPKQFRAVFPCLTAVKVAREGLGDLLDADFGSGRHGRVFPGRGRLPAAAHVRFQACDDGHHRRVLSSARPGPLQGAESHAPLSSALLLRA